MTAPRREYPDMLTVAYMAMGVAKAIKEHGDRRGVNDWRDRYGGELGLVGEVTARAIDLDRYADVIGWEDGVFVYEIAEPFGEQYATALIKGEDVNVGALIRSVFGTEVKRSTDITIDVRCPKCGGRIAIVESVLRTLTYEGWTYDTEGYLQPDGNPVDDDINWGSSTPIKNTPYECSECYEQFAEHQLEISVIENEEEN